MRLFMLFIILISNIYPQVQEGRGLEVAGSSKDTLRYLFVYDGLDNTAIDSTILNDQLKKTLESRLKEFSLTPFDVKSNKNYYLPCAQFQILLYPDAAHLMQVRFRRQIFYQNDNYKFSKIGDTYNELLFGDYLSINHLVKAFSVLFDKFIHDYIKHNRKA